jgi:creatinine amidohydrolase/Fe(II)-dependent formamide hydrolase-like protein
VRARPNANRSPVSVARQFLAAVLHGGFRTLHLLIHHQTGNFMAGMPADLTFKRAARQAIFAHPEREWGEGWWGGRKRTRLSSEQRAWTSCSITCVRS